jgi:hypothetical protein
MATLDRPAVDALISLDFHRGAGAAAQLAYMPEPDSFMEFL